jgi:hypothetical protein
LSGNHQGNLQQIAGALRFGISRSCDSGLLKRKSDVCMSACGTIDQCRNFSDARISERRGGTHIGNKRIDRDRMRLIGRVAVPDLALNIVAPAAYGPVRKQRASMFCWNYATSIEEHST